MNTISHQPLVELTRGEQIESIHFGSVAISDSYGLLKTYGDATSSFFLRSSAKPFQALALLEHNGAEIYQLTPKEIAILCSSHSGTDEHVAVLERIHKKIGIHETDLQCGIHPPYDKKTQEQLLLNGKKPTPLHHNCSGKHTSMLALAKILNAPMDSYLSVDHPVQQMILKTFAEMCGVEIENVHIGIDGCSAPVFSIPLPNAALGFARLVDSAFLSEPRAKACQQIYHAMTENADMVAGSGRFDTVFMNAMQAGALSKSGAEGYLGIAIPSVNEKTGGKGLGITIKISDGDLENRAAPLVALEILRQLGLLNNEILSKLTQFDQRELKNWRDLKVGIIRPSLSLKNFVNAEK